MKAGRKPKPTQMKVVQGTFRKDRANPGEPKPKRQLPPCPGFLKGTARQEYFRIGRKLERIGVLTEIDDLALIGLCQSWAEYVEATEQVRKTGMLVKAPSGYPILNPYVMLANQALKRVKAFLTEFGMTPSSRTRVMRRLTKRRWIADGETCYEGTETARLSGYCADVRWGCGVGKYTRLQMDRRLERPVFDPETGLGTIFRPVWRHFGAFRMGFGGLRNGVYLRCGGPCHVDFAGLWLFHPPLFNFDNTKKAPRARSKSFIP